MPKKVSAILFFLKNERINAADIAIQLRNLLDKRSDAQFFVFPSKDSIAADINQQLFGSMREFLVGIRMVKIPHEGSVVTFVTHSEDNAAMAAIKELAKSEGWHDHLSSLG